ncbi:hypothetical protein MMC25_003904 [Agyrium rufum]|nr:hypothetical protein [Agyrium rufum]
MYKLMQQMRILLAQEDGARKEWKLEGAGCLFWLFKKMFRIIDRPWKMYPLGVMFGLGFDTSSEVALLGIASIQGAKGTSIWLILIFPILFTEVEDRAYGVLRTAGMCLLDTLDGALMLTLNTTPSLASDNIAILYYSIVLTGIMILVALIIGILQLLTLVLNVTNAQGKFWDGVATAGNYYDVIGGSICASFLIFGALSVAMYKPWRRYVDRGRVDTRLELHEDLEQEVAADGKAITSGFAQIGDDLDGKKDLNPDYERQSYKGGRLPVLSISVDRIDEIV